MSPERLKLLSQFLIYLFENDSDFVVGAIRDGLRVTKEFSLEVCQSPGAVMFSNR